MAAINPPVGQRELDSALNWLRTYDLFWQVRARFFELAFGREAKDPRAMRPIPGAEGYLSLNPILARGLWDRAMSERGQGLTRDAAIELSSSSPEDRVARAEAAFRALGVTAAGRKPFDDSFRPLEEDDNMWPPGFWNWVAAEGIAAGLDHG
jgi:hypothetical protein